MEKKEGNNILTNYKFLMGIIIILLLVIIYLLIDGRKQESAPVVQGEIEQQGTPQTPTQDTAATPEATEPAEAEEPENNLEENSHASIDRLVEEYCEYIASGDVESLEGIVDVLTDEEKEKIANRASFIESFDNVTCYTKNGPVDDSYIVFVCYDMKLINIETSAPDIICLYVGPKGEEGRRIHYGDIDESMREYVAELEKDPEVQALYDDVRARYQTAQENDETLSAFIQRINGQVAENEPQEGEGEGEGEAPAEGEEQPTEEPEAQPEEPEEQPAEEQQPEVTAQNRQTHVNDTVNVRAERSTESARLALAYAGDAITQIESYSDGWSKVEYNGQTGYVMTEYIE